MAAACSFRSVARAPPPLRGRGLSTRGARCRSAAPPSGVASISSSSKLVLEVKERLEREHPDLPTGRNGRDDEEMILWFLKDRKFSVDEAVSKLTKAIKWRQDYRISELSEESVKGLYQTGKAYVHDSFDVYGRPVLVVVASKHFPSSPSRRPRFGSCPPPPIIIKYFAWLVAHCRCWMTNRLAARGIPCLLQCSLCGQHPESIDHLLVSCLESSLLWWRILSVIGLQPLLRMNQ